MLFLVGLVRFLLTVEAVFGKESGDSDSDFVALLDVDDFCVIVLLIDAFYAAASANAWGRRHHTVGWDGMFEVVLLASWAHANATDMIGREGALLNLNLLDLWRESWEAWWRGRDVDDASGARLRVFLRLVSMCVVAGVLIGHVALCIPLEHRRRRWGQNWRWLDRLK
jgi:hypothetical protein